MDDIGQAAPAAVNAATDAMAGIADVAKDAAKATYQAVSAQASELVSNVADELSTTAEDQKRRGAETMRSFAGAVKSAAGELEGQSPLVARQFRNAADRIEDLSMNLKDRSIGQLFGAASDLARRQPVSFFAGAIVAGFALSRFLKSSAPATPAAEPQAPGTWRSNPLPPVSQQG